MFVTVTLVLALWTYRVIRGPRSSPGLERCFLGRKLDFLILPESDTRIACDRNGNSRWLLDKGRRLLGRPDSLSLARKLTRRGELPKFSNIAVARFTTALALRRSDALLAVAP